MLQFILRRLPALVRSHMNSVMHPKDNKINNRNNAPNTNRIRAANKQKNYNQKESCYTSAFFWSQAAQALVVRSFFFSKSLFERSARETRHRDIYCYVTTEFTWNVTLHVELLCYNCLNLQRFVWGKTLLGILAEILIFLG